MANHRSGGTQLHTKVTPDLRSKIDAHINSARAFGSGDCPKTIQDYVVQALWYFMSYNSVRLSALRKERTVPKAKTGNYTPKINPDSDFVKNSK